MSKWHKVELTIKQMGEVWVQYPRVTAFNEGRVKIRPYQTFVDVDGKTKRKPVRFGTTISANEITYVFKFKDPAEAMAFKLRWS